MQGVKNVIGKWKHLRGQKSQYARLRKHLDSQPLGMPRTPTGVEYRLLRAMFQPDDIPLALAMNHHFQTAEAIAEQAKSNGFEGDAAERLERLDKGGAVLARERDGVRCYALAPYVIGMYEMQLKRMNSGFYMDTREFFLSGYSLEFLGSQVPQFRVIPIEKSLTPQLGVASYDEVREIVSRAGTRVAIAECICKKGQDLLDEPCQVTKEREVCLVLNGGVDQYVTNGWARSITQEEALERLAVAEKDGLVLQPSNFTDPEFICACCKCCCGILENYATVPRPVDFVATNFQARVDEELCVGCGKCVKRCQMDAVKVEEKTAVILEERCIGCGLCVPTCKKQAMSLVKREQETAPPADHDDLYETIAQGKGGPFSGYIKGLKGLVGLKL